MHAPTLRCLVCISFQGRKLMVFERFCKRTKNHRHKFSSSTPLAPYLQKSHAMKLFQVYRLHIQLKIAYVKFPAALNVQQHQHYLVTKSGKLFKSSCQYMEHSKKKIFFSSILLFPCSDLTERKGNKRKNDSAI